MPLPIFDTGLKTLDCLLVLRSALGFIDSISDPLGRTESFLEFIVERIIRIVGCFEQLLFRRVSDEHQPQIARKATHI